MNIPQIRLDWFVLVGIGICLGTLFTYSPNPNLRAERLAYKVDHAMDIIKELKELSQNIAIKDATDYFEGGDSSGCGKEMFLPSDINLAGAIIDIKTKQAYEILHQVLIELKAS